jgi:hypothetical protein
MAELEAARKRLLDDRQAGLHDDDACGTEWHRTEYKRTDDEITALKALPEGSRECRAIRAPAPAVDGAAPVPVLPGRRRRGGRSG